MINFYSTLVSLLHSFEADVIKMNRQFPLFRKLLPQWHGNAQISVIGQRRTATLARFLSKCLNDCCTEESKRQTISIQPPVTSKASNRVNVLEIFRRQ